MSTSGAESRPPTEQSNTNPGAVSILVVSIIGSLGVVVLRMTEPRDHVSSDWVKPAPPERLAGTTPCTLTSRMSRLLAADCSSSCATQGRSASTGAEQERHYS